MKTSLSISNIAWDPSEDELIVSTLSELGIRSIDIAPGKYFPRPSEVSAAEIKKVRDWWRSYGITIVGMQSLLFGTEGLNIFSSPETRRAMVRYLQQICRIAAGLGASRLVFGSPKNRDRGDLSDSEAFDIATAFFYDLGIVAAAEGVVMCLEANPPCYGCNFMMFTGEATAVVRAVNHPNIRLQLDTGALITNRESAIPLLEEAARLIGHVHISEPHLVPIGDGDSGHDALASIIRQYYTPPVATIEMLATTNEPHVTSVRRAVDWVRAHYMYTE